MSENDHAVVAVRDASVGIAPDDGEWFGDRHERIGHGMAGGIGGIGLGPAIADEIANMHIGRLLAERDVGERSTIPLRVPLRQPAA